MSIKFKGMKGKNRLRLKPKSPEAQLIVDNLAHTPSLNGTPIEIYDGSFGICLGQSEVSCDGAYETLGIEENLNYDVGWTLYLGGEEYGRFTSENPIEYTSRWKFDYKISVNYNSGALWITNTSGGDLRIQLKPDSILANPNMSYIDSDSMFSERDSENVLVGDDGSIFVCLRSSDQPEEAS